MNEQQIESLLRKAPVIRAPRELRERLKGEIELTPGLTTRPARPPLNAPGFRRWIPALGFAVWFFTCVVVLGIQAGRIAELKARNHALEVESQAAGGAVAPSESKPVAETAADNSAKDQNEIERLRAEVAELRAMLAELSALNVQNAKLRAEIAARRAATSGAAPQQDFFVVQQEKADNARCINNIRQIVLAAYTWSRYSHSDFLPVDFASMKKELSNRVFSCGRDGSAPYVLVSPGAKVGDRDVVFVRCPVHNNVGLCDGSANILGAERRIAQREDGAWIIQRVEQ